MKKTKIASCLLAMVIITTTSIPILAGDDQSGSNDGVQGNSGHTENVSSQGLQCISRGPQDFKNIFKDVDYRSVGNHLVSLNDMDAMEKANQMAHDGQQMRGLSDRPGEIGVFQFAKVNGQKATYSSSSPEVKQRLTRALGDGDFRAYAKEWGSNVSGGGRVSGEDLDFLESVFKAAAARMMDNGLTKEEAFRELCNDPIMVTFKNEEELNRYLRDYNKIVEKERKQKGNPPKNGDSPRLHIHHVIDNHCPIPPLAWQRKLDGAVDAGANISSGILTTKLKLTPVLPKKFELLNKEQQKYWFATHVPQEGEPEHTAYYSVINANKKLISDTYNSEAGALSDYNKIGYENSWQNFREQAKKANEAPPPALRIVFNDQNKIGLARGGVYTITVHELHYTTVIPLQVDTYEWSQCVEKYHYPERISHEECHEEKTKNKDGKTITKNVCRDVFDYYRIHHVYNLVVQKSRVPDNKPYAKNSGTTTTGWQIGNSYQLLGVRCNKTEFDKIIQSKFGTRLDNGSGKAYSLGQSMMFTGTVANSFNQLDVDFFYNGKTCDDIFGCTSQPNIAAKHDAKNNKVMQGATTKEFGAQNLEENTVGSKFQFFRDNLPHSTRVDVWWLKDKDKADEVVFDNNAPSYLTYTILDQQGTPTDKIFNLYDKKKELLKTGTQIKNGDVGLVLKGQENVFYWSGAFASENGKEHGMNIKYRYKPMVRSHLPKYVSANGATMGEDTEEVLDMYCKVHFNTDKSYTPIIKNQPKPDSTRPETGYVNSDDESLRVGFVKSSRE